ncbi:hypothetical protein [Sporosarcina sp. Te-1]|uniref:hypothetical protein n=1 Tax=Sporosarcina sp. Te-1 TaxID=2818390 RepID=UPI001A9D85E7|nr:hypothetical protein [Sporosarcina sp. Te-1]QTD40993.1 hypothetical protein J3U78_20030 [Sporosarcina sp. Te-1]
MKLDTVLAFLAVLIALVQNMYPKMLPAIGIYLVNVFQASWLSQCWLDIIIIQQFKIYTLTKEGN